jgi:hypothetical protein
MLIYQEFLAENNVNELAAFDPSERLRYAVHEIVIRLKNDTTQIKFEEMSKILKNEFNINISTALLKEIFSAFDRYNDPDYSIFKKDDKNWLDVWPYAGYVRKKLRDKQSFGKHRNKASTASTTASNTDWSRDRTYYANGYYNEYGVWIPYKTNTGGKKRTFNEAEDDDKKYPEWFCDSNETQKYNDFILEWGTDANKPQTKVSDRMMSDIEIEKDQEDNGEIEDQLEIMFGSVDMNESVIEEDPYGEEDWNYSPPDMDYKNYKKGLYNWLKQLKNDFIDECLDAIENRTKKEAKLYIDDIIYELGYDEGENIPQDQLNAIKRDIDELYDLCCDNEEYIDEGPDPDEWYDSHRERERNY